MYLKKIKISIEMASRSTASIIIIGDEILKGQTKDTNSHFLCKELYTCGIHVSRISVIGDDVDIVANEVHSHSKLYDYVLTAGGIGPTHDDITYEGIAKAFDETLILNKNLQHIFSRLCLKLNLDESAASKMSHIPKSAEIHQTDFIPVVSVQNVFVFPGIPSYLESAFNSLKTLFEKESKPFYNVALYVNLNEFSIASCLDTAVKEFESKVRFGSYPDIESDYYQVKLVLEADSNETLTEAEAFLRSHLPPNSVVGPYPPGSEQDLKALFDGIRDNTMPLKKSFDILDKCYKLYPVENSCLSFNGGKDCTVLLHLASLFLRKRGLLMAGEKLKVFHVKSPQSFPEIEHFIDLCADRYHLEVLTYEHPIKEALSNLKRDHPEIEAILMGSRLTDPHCSGLLPFQETDSGWPRFMRVNPLSHWSYSQVWTFLKELHVPYCSLYDRGYTSLGCQHNTLPNEELLNTTKNGTAYYMPAYMLKDPQQERRGRSSKTV